MTAIPTQRSLTVTRGRIEIQRLNIRFGDHAAVEDFSLTVTPGEFVCLLGPSGCGKSTVLNSVAGFIPPSQGRVAVDDVVVTRPGPERGMVFQQHSLFPWKTVLENVAFGPRMQGRPRAEANDLAKEYLELVGLGASADRYPATLSGGMQQRVGIARALVNHPSVLLMDEPFGALDALTRRTLQDELLRVWEELKKTVVFVTHSLEESIYLADRIVLMTYRPGTVKLDMAIRLPRMRDPASGEFNAIKKELGSLLMAEQQRHVEAEFS